MELWDVGSSQLKGIRVTLSNGEQSPCFVAGECMHSTTINFRQDLEARKIEMVVASDSFPQRDSEDVPATLCRGFKIMDVFGKDIAKWSGNEEGEYR